MLYPVKTVIRDLQLLVSRNFNLIMVEICALIMIIVRITHQNLTIDKVFLRLWISIEEDHHRWMSGETLSQVRLT